MNSIPLAYRLREAARLIGVSRSTTYKLVQQGKLKIHKIGNCSVIRADDLRQLLDS